MTDAELRLECLKLSTEYTHDGDDLIVFAAEIYEWVKEGEE